MGKIAGRLIALAMVACTVGLVLWLIDHAGTFLSPDGGDEFTIASSGMQLSRNSGVTDQSHGIFHGVVEFEANTSLPLQLCAQPLSVTNAQLRCQAIEQTEFLWSLPSATYRFYTHSPNIKLAPIEVDILPAQTVKATLYVVATAAVHGKLFSSDQQPINDAVVELYQYGEIVDTIMPHNDGSFMMEATPGPAMIMTTTARFGTDVRNITLPDPDLEIQLNKAIAVRGRVISRLSGEPVAGVTVKASRGDWGWDSHDELDQITSSDASGFFELNGLGGKEIYISAKSAQWLGSLEQPIIPSQTTSPMEVDLLVDPTVTASGILRKSDGSPCIDGFIQLTRQNTSEYKHKTLAKNREKIFYSELNNGYVELDNLFSGRYQATARCGPLQLVNGSNVIDLEADTAQTFVWVFNHEPLYDLQVKVQDNSANPLGQVQVMLRDIQLAEFNQASVTTSANGVAIFQQLPASEYEVFATNGGVTSDPALITVDKQNAPVSLLLPPSHPFILTVADENAKPLNNERISVLTEKGQWLDSNGLGDGKYQFNLQSGKQYPLYYFNQFHQAVKINQTIQVSANAKSSTVVLEKAQDQLTGQVVDKTGIPAANVRVTLLPLPAANSVRDDSPAALNIHTRTDRNGIFEFKNITNDNLYTVAALDARQYSARKTNISSSNGGLVLQLKPPLVVTGSLQNQGGTAADARIVIQHSDFDFTTLAVPDKNGHWQASGIPPGRWQITAINVDQQPFGLAVVEETENNLPVTLKTYQPAE